MSAPARLAALTALAALAAAVPAGAAFQEVGAFVTPMYTDGERYAAAQLEDGRTRIFDTRERRSLTFTPPAGYTLVGTGGGQVAWQCDGCRPGPSDFENYLDAVVLTLASGRVTTPPAVDHLSGEPMAYKQVGEHWLYGERYSYHSESPFWFGWRTGRGRGDEPDERHAGDLDRFGLGPKLCEPLRRPEFVGRDPAVEYHRDWAPYAYERPYGLWTSFEGELMLDRCGQVMSRKIGSVNRYRDAALNAQLGAGLVSWFRHGAAHIYAVRSGRRRTWDVPANLTRVRHTRGRLFVSVYDRPVWRLMRMTIPKSLRG